MALVLGRQRVRQLASGANTMTFRHPLAGEVIARHRLIDRAGDDLASAVLAFTWLKVAVVTLSATLA